jgi:hypothetical protein
MQQKLTYQEMDIKEANDAFTLLLNHPNIISTSVKCTNRIRL